MVDKYQYQYPNQSYDSMGSSYPVGQQVSYYNGNGNAGNESGKKKKQKKQ